MTREQLRQAERALAFDRWKRDNGYKAVKYEKLAGLIIQAINELANEVDELKKKIQ